MAHELPELPYSHDALEPFIDSKTMEIHHGKHHNAYVTNLGEQPSSHPLISSFFKLILHRAYLNR